MSDDLTPDEVRAALRDYFGDRPGLAEVRALRAAEVATGAAFDREGWSTLANQLGLPALGAPEAWGGLGLGLGHLVAAVEECGASLYPGPVRAAAALSVDLAGLDPEDAPEELIALVGSCLAGDAVPGLALVDARPAYAEGTLSGRVAAVTHGAAADLVLCVADTPAGPAVVLADARTAERQPVTTRDFGGPVADLVLEAAPAAPLTPAGDVGALDGHHALVALLLAAEQVGGAQGCLSGMVEYAGVREQFDQLIGSYQAIQHRCATLAVDAAATRALVAGAAAFADAGQAKHARSLGLLARAEAADLFNRAADGYIQVSGGIGFTWEHDAHLFFRRARSTAALGGTPARHRDAAVEAGCLDLLLVPAS